MFSVCTVACTEMDALRLVYLQGMARSSSTIAFRLEFKARSIQIPGSVIKAHIVLHIFRIHAKDEKCCSF